MKLGAKLLLPLFILLVLPQVVLAHPGNTAADGCHYCRTNCAKWGEVEGARHCHGGYQSVPVYSNTVTPTKKPIATITPKPTFTPAITLSATPTIQPAVQSVSGEQNQNTITPTPQVNTAGDSTGSGLIGIGFVGALIYFGYRVFKKKKSQEK
jgi:hypothetical protein